MPTPHSPLLLFRRCLAKTATNAFLEEDYVAWVPGPRMSASRNAELICPTGQISKTCPASLAKIFRFSLKANQLPISAYPVPTRGAFRDRHERWTRGAMDAKLPLTNGSEADGEVVWS